MTHRQWREEHVVHGCAGAGLPRPGDFAPAPGAEGMLRRDGSWQDSQSRPFFSPPAEDEIVHRPGDALPPPRRAYQQLSQRERAALMLGSELVRQRAGQVPPPGRRRSQRHPAGPADHEAATTGRHQDKAWLAALDPEAVRELRAVIGAPVGRVGVDLGVQGLQLLPKQACIPSSTSNDISDPDLSGTVTIAPPVPDTSTVPRLGTIEP